MSLKLTLVCSIITYGLCISLAKKLGFVSQNGLDRFIFVPSCNQGKLLLSTTNDNLNVKLDKNKTRPHIVPTVTDIVRKIPTLGELTNAYDD